MTDKLENKIDLVIREETLENERRTCITPEQVAKLTKEGYKVALDEWEDRIFTEEEYRKAVEENGTIGNFEIINTGQWEKEERFSKAIILGTKEIVHENPLSKDFALQQTFIHFDHSYKGQTKSEERLLRFGFADYENNNPLLGRESSGSLLLDHEYVTDENGKRTHAFGESAGYATTAMSVLMWARKINGNELKLEQYSYDDKDDFLKLAAKELSEAIDKAEYAPNALILGGENGRSAIGSRKFLGDINKLLEEEKQITHDRWGRKETSDKQRTEGLDGIVEYDIVINCVFTGEPCPPFINDKMIDEASDKVRIFGDVTCDTTPDKNRLRFEKYKTKDFDDPTVEVANNTFAITVDHSPSFFPKEATIDFANQFFSHLKELLAYKKEDKEIPKDSVWGRAKEAFENAMEIQASAYRLGNNLAHEFFRVENHIGKTKDDLNGQSRYREPLKGMSIADMEKIPNMLEGQKDILQQRINSLAEHLSAFRSDKENQKGLTPEEAEAFLEYVAAGVMSVHEFQNDNVQNKDKLQKVFDKAKNVLRGSIQVPSGYIEQTNLSEIETVKSLSA